MVQRYIILIVSFVVLSCGNCAVAQDDEDAWYRLELGGGVGMASMLNDANSALLGNSGFAANVVARFPLNPRMAIKTGVTYMSSKGDVSGVKNFYPAEVGVAGDKRLEYDYTGEFYDLSVLYELHFLPYGYLPTYMGYSRIVPYFQLGLGATYSGISKKAAFNIPIGFGVKYKLARRLNLNFDWKVSFTTSDMLEGLEAPMGIHSSGFKNKDHYSAMMLTLTYDLSPKCPTCNKY